jgi:hypothetical protein
MSDEELMERWTGGQLTELAMEVARAEFSKRGIQPPQVATQAGADEPAAEEETVTFVTVARSLVPWDLEILRARLEADGIASFVVDGDINRMNSLWSIAVGGVRLLVPQQQAAQARQIISDVKSGKFALREGDEVN